MRSCVIALVAGIALAGSVSAQTIKGEYLEARNADIWTGPCFANGEMGIVGNKATMAWKVTEGIYNDVRLDGLSVVAVVIGDRTFGLSEKVTTRTVFIVDEKATGTQESALIALASKLAGDTIQQVVGVERAKIQMETGLCEKLGCAKLSAGNSKIETRCLCKSDTICGHEDMFYPPLSKVDGAFAAYTLKNQYTGSAFGETFKDSNARSAVIANFVL
jgi:hypothetical protein